MERQQHGMHAPMLEALLLTVEGEPPRPMERQQHQPTHDRERLEEVVPARSPRGSGGRRHIQRVQARRRAGAQARNAQAGAPRERAGEALTCSSRPDERAQTRRGTSSSLR